MVLAALLSGSGGGGGGKKNDPPIVSGLQLEDAETSPALVSFVLSDRESDPADVEVRFEAAAKAGLIARLEGLPTSRPPGTRHTLPWAFARDLGSGLTDNAAITVEIPGVTAARISGRAVGNDPPQIRSVRLPGGREVAGIVQADITVSDSSNHTVSIGVDYEICPCDPDPARALWQPAAPAGSRLDGIQAPRQGRQVSFFWNVVADLGSRKAEVRLRITPDDGIPGGEGASYFTDPFTVNNNQKPIARIFVQDFDLNLDRRGGIAVPFEVFDADGHEVDVVFQWTPAGVPFPALPDTPEDLAAILRDPAKRLQHRIASEHSVPIEGRVVPVDPRLDPEGVQIRLPEVTRTAATLLARGMVGRTIEILRSPRVMPAAGEPADLSRPVAAIPLGDGGAVLVLDSPSPGAWRLRELQLGSGRIERSVASGSEGSPTAMAIEPAEGAVLLAVLESDRWKILRVELAAGSTELLFTAETAPASDGVRSLAILGGGVALLTAGDALLKINYDADPARRKVHTILEGLKTPWGVAADPLRPGRIYLAERDFDGPAFRGRVLALDLGTLARVPLRPRGLDLERPSSIALDPAGKRLLAVTDAGGDGAHEIRRLELTESAAGEVSEVASGLAGEVRGLAAGPDGLTVVALTDQDRIAVGGGVEARRTIVDYSPLGHVATVDRAFEPRLTASRRWRIRERLGRVKASPGGKREVFVWDSSDLAFGGRVLLQAVPFDTEIGVADDSGIPRTVEESFAEEPLILGGDETTFSPQSVIAADLDEDGRLDLVTANVGDICVFFQESLGGAAPNPDVTLGGLVGARSVHAQDLNGDGHLDLAAADFLGNALLVFFQKAPGDFGIDPRPLRLEGLKGPRSVVAADFNGDGNMDLASANQRAGNITVFFQKDPGMFGPVPDGTLGDSQVLLSPTAIAAGDFDGDGDLDLAAACELGDSLKLFFQESPGVFGRRPALILGSPRTTFAPEFVLALDLNRDGRVDLASANQLGRSIAVFFQGPSGFAELGEPVVLGGLMGPRSVAAGDLDGDGFPDLIAADVEGDALSAFFQKSPGAFGTEPGLDFKVPGMAGRPVSVIAADMDGDGRVDLASANSFANRIFLYRHRSPELFRKTPDQLLGGTGVTDGARSVSAGDLDGDGDLDLVTACEGSLSLAVFLQKNPRVFESKPDLIMKIPVNPRSVQAADLNGDGKLDLFSGARDIPGNQIRYQGSGGSFEEAPQQIPLDARFFFIDDLDGDGSLDLALSVGIDHAIPMYILFQRSQRAFETLPVQERNSTVLGLVAADLNGDGALDLVSAGQSVSNYLLGFFQKGPRGFAAPPDLKLGGPQVSVSAGEPLVNPIPLLAADLNQDGRVDLVSAHVGRNVLEVFLQGEPGVFPARPLVLGGPNATRIPRAIAAADLDGDGDLDLVSANEEGNDLALFLQRSPFTFSSDPDFRLDGVQGPLSLLAVDLDGDGALDLVTANKSGNNLAIFYGSR